MVVRFMTFIYYDVFLYFTACACVCERDGPKLLGSLLLPFFKTAVTCALFQSVDSHPLLNEKFDIYTCIQVSLVKCSRSPSAKPQPKVDRRPVTPNTRFSLNSATSHGPRPAASLDIRPALPLWPEKGAGTFSSSKSPSGMNPSL